MATTLTQARKILTAPELDLFAHSRTEGLKALTPARLRAKLVRARALRDKYQDLYRRQALAARDRTASKRGTSGAANERTHDKAAVFTEVIERFEQRIAYCEAVEAREQARRDTAASRAAAKPAARKTAAKAGRKTLGATSGTKAREAAARSGARARAKADTKAAAAVAGAPAAPRRAATPRARTRH